MAKDLYISALLDVYGEFLSVKSRTLTDYYYNEDLSLAEISENEGITRQGVRDAVKRAEIQLKELEEKCGYCEKFLRLKELSPLAKSGDLSAQQEIFSIIDDL